jgi:hypothetical protein
MLFNITLKGEIILLIGLGLEDRHKLKKLMGNEENQKIVMDKIDM